MNHFPDSMGHLLAELERLDLHLRSLVASMRKDVAKDPAMRGLYIAEADVDALLEQPVGRSRWLPPVPPSRALEALCESIDQRARGSLERGIDLRLPRLRDRFGLDAFEVDVLLLAVAVDIDLRYERLFAYLQDDVTRKRPNVGLMLNVLAPALDDQLRARRAFSARATLRARGLITLFDEMGQASPPLLARLVKADDRVVRYLLGDDEPDERLAAWISTDGPEPCMDRHLLGDAVARRLDDVIAQARAGSPLVVHLVGGAGAGKRDAAWAAARELGRPLLALDLERLLAAEMLDALWPLVDREAKLLGAVVCCTGFDSLLAPVRRPVLEAWLRRLDAHETLVFILGSQAFEPVGDARRLPLARIPFPALEVAQRTAIWRLEIAQQIGACEALDLDELAGKFKFGPMQIRDVAASVRRGRSAPESLVTLEQIHDACRLHSSQQLSSVARKIVPKYRWSDIVLPPDRLTLLRDICNHVKYRGLVHGDWGFGRRLAMGKGLAVLFAGPSGTGKTMAADIIAGELGLDLFKIDLATVMSKYIGETEKNLGLVFDEAEASNAVLFFDEADALFGKRSEVNDSHDRYANIQVAYLLQRIEEYQGVAILATNLHKNMDEAFVRRLQFTIEFPFPNGEERQRIWRGIWPDAVPRGDDVDLDDLAQRFEIAGGSIRNVALSAAFLAADDGRVVRARHVLAATRREYQKMGKLTGDRTFAAVA